MVAACIIGGAFTPVCIQIKEKVNAKEGWFDPVPVLEISRLPLIMEQANKYRRKNYSKEATITGVWICVSFDLKYTLIYWEKAQIKSVNLSVLVIYMTLFYLSRYIFAVTFVGNWKKYVTHYAIDFIKNLV